MDGRFDEATLTLMRNLALQNAIQHGHAHPKALMGKLLGQRADLRSAVPAVVEALERIVSEVNAMDSGERRSALDASAPEMLDAKPKNVRPQGLPDLPDRSGDVVLRFAPNPNGPLSFGHSRGVAINAAYAKRHGGTFILRFDDTDTVRKPPLDWAYDHITEEVTWLVGSPPDRVVLASDRVEVYHAHAKALLEQGGAYVCRCTADAFRGYRESKSACPCRDRPIEDSNADWQQMIEGRFSAGEAVVRIRTAMDLPNPALRDWPALRIQDTDRNPHPRPEVGSRHKVWPLLDFQSAIEDHEQGVTHIIRGKDLMDSTRKQMLLYEHFGWTYPVTLYWGRVKVHEFGSFSTSACGRTSRTASSTDGMMLAYLRWLRCADEASNQKPWSISGRSSASRRRTSVLRSARSGRTMRIESMPALLAWHSYAPLDASWSRASHPTIQMRSRCHDIQRHRSVNESSR